MRKSEELRDPASCLSKARPEEPVFVLRANDPLFAQTVRLWATMAVGVHESEKIQHAHDLANYAEKWRADQQPKVAAAAADPPPYGLALGSGAANIQQQRQR